MRTLGGTAGSDEREQAHTLGELVARGLVEQLRLPPGLGAVEQLRLDRLRIDVTARPGESTEQLAGRIVDRIATRLEGAR